MAFDAAPQKAWGLDAEPGQVFLKLKHGTLILVSECDYDRLMQWSWREHQARSHLYARRDYRAGGKKKCRYLHQEVVGAAAGVVVDHQNGNTFDCTRNNLRITGYSGNAHNAPYVTSNRSGEGFRGVREAHPGSGRFRADIKFQGEALYLGTFDTAEEAADAYDEKAIQLYGEFAWTNAVRNLDAPREIYEIPF